jgi:hypothetical protein
MSENNITINVSQQSRGAGTALVIIFLWPALLMWWVLLAALWIKWLMIAGIVTIFDHGFFGRNWYQPWPAWMFGIR